MFKKCIHSCLDDLTIIDKIDLNGKSYNNIFIYHLFIYHLPYNTPHSIKPLHVIFHEQNGYVKDYDGSTYLTLVATDDEKKDVLEKYEEKTLKMYDYYRKYARTFVLLT